MSFVDKAQNPVGSHIWQSLVHC